jgi:hypothetical protein
MAFLFRKETRKFYYDMIKEAQDRAYEAGLYENIESDILDDPETVIGRRIAKYYMHVVDNNEGVQLFSGSIVGYDKKKKLWTVHYSDDKKEALPFQDVLQGLCFDVTEDDKDIFIPSDNTATTIVSTTTIAEQVFLPPTFDEASETASSPPTFALMEPAETLAIASSPHNPNVTSTTTITETSGGDYNEEFFSPAIIASTALVAPSHVEAFVPPLSPEVVPTCALTESMAMLTIVSPPPPTVASPTTIAEPNSHDDNEDFISPSVLPETLLPVTPFSLMSYHGQSRISPMSPYAVSIVNLPLRSSANSIPESPFSLMSFSVSSPYSPMSPDAFLSIFREESPRPLPLALFGHEDTAQIEEDITTVNGF